MAQTDFIREDQVNIFPELHLVQAEETLTERLEGLYQLNDPEPVKDFLRCHPFLINLLIEAWRQIQVCFGEEVEAALELFKDPEEANGAGKIFALIQTGLSISEALSRLEKLDQEWWLEASARSEGLLNIDLEYI